MENQIEINADTDVEVSPDDGQAALTEAEATEEEYNDEDFFDYTQFADNKVKLQVNGEEVVVPLQEALAGYQRQADYTRKTQELSEQRKQIQYAAALQEALEKDPAKTLQLLQETYGLTNPDTQEDWAEEDWTDPSTQQIRSLEQRIAAFEQQKAMEDLQRTIDNLQSKYGEAFDPDEVVAKALAEGSTDLEGIFKKIAFDKVYSQAQSAQKKTSEEQARLDAKRQAAIISSATSAPVTTAPTSSAPKSVYEAFENAKRQLGL